MRPAISPTKCVQVLKGTPPPEWSWAATEPKLDAAGKSAQNQFSLQENSQRIQAMRRLQRANQRIVGDSGLLPSGNQTLQAPMAWPNFSSSKFIASHRQKVSSFTLPSKLYRTNRQIRQNLMFLWVKILGSIPAAARVKPSKSLVLLLCDRCSRSRFAVRTRNVESELGRETPFACCCRSLCKCHEKLRNPELLEARHFSK